MWPGNEARTPSCLVQGFCILEPMSCIIAEKVACYSGPLHQDRVTRSRCATVLLTNAVQGITEGLRGIMVV